MAYEREFEERAQELLSKLGLFAGSPWDDERRMITEAVLRAERARGLRAAANICDLHGPARLADDLRRRAEELEREES